MDSRVELLLAGVDGHGCGDAAAHCAGATASRDGGADLRHLTLTVTQPDLRDGGDGPMVSLEVAVRTGAVSVFRVRCDGCGSDEVRAAIRRVFQHAVIALGEWARPDEIQRGERAVGDDTAREGNEPGQKLSGADRAPPAVASALFALDGATHHGRAGHDGG